MLHGILSNLKVIKDQWGELRQAVQRGDEATVDSILNSWLKPSPHFHSKENEVFKIAIPYPNILVKLIRAYNRDIPGDYRVDLLHSASENGHANIVAALLEECDENSRQHKGYVLTLAAEKGHADVVVALLKDDSEEPIDARSLERGFRDAASNGHVDVVTALFKESGTKLHPVHKCEALRDLIKLNSHADGVVSLLEAYCSEIFSESGAKFYECLVNTVLRHAADHAEALRAVLKPCTKELSLQYITWAFNVAVDNGHVCVATMLLQNYNEKITREVLGRGLRDAASKGHVGIVILLLKECDTKIYSGDKLAAFRDLVRYAHIDGVAALLEEHCDVLFSIYGDDFYESLVDAVLLHALDKPDVVMAVLKPCGEKHPENPSLFLANFDSKKQDKKRREMENLRQELDDLFEQANKEISEQFEQANKKSNRR